MNVFKKILLSVAILAMPLSASAQIAANNCPLGKWAMGIGSNGSLICSYLSDNDIPNNITVVTDQQMIVTKNPATTSSASASLRINPLTAPATSKLMAIQDNGTDRFTVTKEGNATISGDLNVN